MPSSSRRTCGASNIPLRSPRMSTGFTTSADYYEWHHRLTGSCDMGRSEFAKRHGYKLTDDELLTVEEFIKLTENSYGGSVIRKLRAAYKEEATG